MGSGSKLPSYLCRRKTGIERTITPVGFLRGCLQKGQSIAWGDGILANSASSIIVHSPRPGFFNSSSNLSLWPAIKAFPEE